MSTSPALLHDPDALRRRVAQWKREGLRVGLVPTMGNLHSGHLALVDAAAARAGRVVVSIFVNPLQFGPGEDFASYPRTLAEDMDKLAATGAAAVFAPPEDVMYPSGRDGVTRVEVPAISEELCGASRPGHFVGVATVVAKLFNLVAPDVAVFGRKDFQQLVVIRRMARDLCFPVEIVGLDTVREPDGLAMSSRNAYLTREERARAPALYQALVAAGGRLTGGDRDFVAIQQEGMENVRSAGLEPEYFEVRRRDDLAAPAAGDSALVVLAAARLGRARLIDNLPVDVAEHGRGKA
ncbi:MAG: pantoate--beta-alanine ligase [Gammaproteobacteria bacterium]